MTLLVSFKILDEGEAFQIRNYPITIHHEMSCKLRDKMKNESTSVVQSKEMNTRKRKRLQFGEGLVSYEKSKKMCKEKETCREEKQKVMNEQTKSLYSSENGKYALLVKITFDENDASLVKTMLNFSYKKLYSNYRKKLRLYSYSQKYMFIFNDLDHFTSLDIREYFESMVPSLISFGASVDFQEYCTVEPSNLHQEIVEILSCNILKTIQRVINETTTDEYVYFL